MQLQQHNSQSAKLQSSLQHGLAWYDPRKLLLLLTQSRSPGCVTWGGRRRTIDRSKHAGQESAIDEFSEVARRNALFCCCTAVIHGETDAPLLPHSLRSLYLLLTTVWQWYTVRSRLSKVEYARARASFSCVYARVQVMYSTRVTHGYQWLYCIVPSLVTGYRYQEEKSYNWFCM